MFEKELFYFTVRDFANFFKINLDKAYRTVKRLKEKRLIKGVEKGKYLLLGFEKEKVLSNPLFIATRLVYPSYVSYWTALNFYGFTEQVPTTIFLATTKKNKSVDFEGLTFKYVQIKPKKFFGYRSMKSADLDILIADKEKAILDSLDQPSYAGGIAEVAKALYNAQNELDFAKLFEYATSFNMSLCSRLGYLLEKFGLEAEKLVKSASKNFVKLEPSVQKTSMWNKKWKINVNLKDEELIGWRET